MQPNHLTHEQERKAGQLVDTHLDLVPYIDLGVSFDPSHFLREALALADRYVEFRGNDGIVSVGWRGVALHGLDGDESQIYVKPGDELRPDTHFRATKAARENPYLFGLTKRIFELGFCRNISVLWLDPGATIPPHVDGVGPAVIRSVNIALNMPEGCEFWGDIHLSGQHHPWSKNIPFRPGRAMLLNVAPPHAVYNKSKEPRIHIIGRGRIRIPESEILALAEAQNKISDSAKLTELLREKYQGTGRPADHLK